MTSPKTIAPLQQLAALAIATVLTTLVLVSLGAQADTRHGDALASAQSANQLLCAAPQRAARS